MGKRETLTIGRYPDVPLAGDNGARERHRAARKLVEKGESPARTKQIRERAKREIAGDTVKAIAESWYAQKAEARSESWQDNARRWLDQDVYPAFGSWPITGGQALGRSGPDPEGREGKGRALSRIRPANPLPGVGARDPQSPGDSQSGERRSGRDRDAGAQAQTARSRRRRSRSSWRLLTPIPVGSRPSWQSSFCCSPSSGRAS